tara:strand:- start:5451 stop:6317 length:867 start_codon:yes stop_codon:yes gene_type:complete
MFQGRSVTHYSAQPIFYFQDHVCIDFDGVLVRDVRLFAYDYKRSITPDIVTRMQHDLNHPDVFAQAVFSFHRQANQRIAIVTFNERLDIVLLYLKIMFITAFNMNLAFYFQVLAEYPELAGKDDLVAAELLINKTIDLIVYGGLKAYQDKNNHIQCVIDNCLPVFDRENRENRVLLIDDDPRNCQAAEASGALALRVDQYFDAQMLMHSINTLCFSCVKKWQLERSAIGQESFGYFSPKGLVSPKEPISARVLQTPRRPKTPSRRATTGSHGKLRARRCLHLPQDQCE